MRKRDRALEKSHKVASVNRLIDDLERRVHRADQASLRRDSDRPFVQMNRRIRKLAKLDDGIVRQLPAEHLLLEVLEAWHEAAMLGDRVDG